jgi:hypothetical protein
MTTAQKVLVGGVVLGALAFAVYQTRRAVCLRAELLALRQQQADATALTNQVQQLQGERDQARDQVSALAAENESLKQRPAETLKLRGEVGRLRQENADMGASSALSKVTANPESRKLLRDQQKAGMTMIYKGFAQQAKLTSEQTGKLNDLLADHIMDNVGNVTAALRDKPASAQLDQMFSAQDATLQEKLKDLLGSDGLAQYQDYTKNLLSSLTGQQFKGMLSGSEEVRDEKSKQVTQIMQEQAQAVLAAAGLPADYQMVPMLNLENIASEQLSDRSLKMLEDVFQQAAARLGTVLTPEELAKFQEFKTTAINNNRSALSLNRTLMAPISK